MQFDKNTKEIIKFVRKMQSTNRYKRNIWNIREQKIKIDIRQVFTIDNIR